MCLSMYRACQCCSGTALSLWRQLRNRPADDAWAAACRGDIDTASRNIIVSSSYGALWICRQSSIDTHQRASCRRQRNVKKGSPYSITKSRVPELIAVLGCQPAGDVSYKPGGRLPLLSARPAVTPATLKRVATNFAAWWTEARWVWTVCLRLLPDSVAAAIWNQAVLRLSPAR